MIVELFIFFELLVIILFLISFFTHQEILWTTTAVISGVLCFTSYNVENYVYVFNSTTNAYAPVAVSYSYPYLMGINLLFFSLALLLGLFDLFDKYSIKVFPKLSGRLKR